MTLSHISEKQGLGVAAWFAVNPFLFPEPEDQGAWGSRAIRGERRWAKARPHDASFAIQSAGAVAAIGGLYSAYKRRLAPAVASAVALRVETTHVPPGRRTGAQIGHDRRCGGHRG